MKIEIITTGDESLIESGSGSAKTCDSILHSIKNSMNHNVIFNVCQTVEDLNNVVKRKPDLAILLVKYIEIKDEETIWLSEFFLKYGINFSGSSKDVLMFDSNKVLAKSYLKGKGISTSRYFTAVPKEYRRDYDIPINYPLFLKPIHSINNDDKEDLLLVKNFTEFENKVLSFYDLYNAPVLVEEYLDGQEFSVSIIEAKDGDMLVSAIEILTPKSNKSNMNLDAQIENNKKLINIEDKVIRNRVKNLAIDVYIELNIRDFGQIDIMTNKSGHCFFMQANLIPIMANGRSRFIEAFSIELGLSYDEIIELIVAHGICRVK